MQISVYVIYELLIRLQELNPAVGEYVSNKRSGDGILVRTSSGTIDIPESILSTQFNNPSLITQDEILSLLDRFKLAVSD
jgi:hypothetical protein